MLTLLPIAFRYRWKSENVSTAEVALALGEHPCISEANVYGVAVPGHEGRAGCAAVVLNTSSPDYGDIVQYARKTLPRYAVPVFLRVVKRSSHIHNHKQNKVGLRKEGVNPTKVGAEEKEGAEDVFLWLRPDADTYIPFQKPDWDKLERGEVRL
jgi:acyl-CoA synthetase (AMP-forming)/AMP-acid ligase II